MRTLIPVAVLAITLSYASRARAEHVVETREDGEAPNSALLGSGIAVFGIPYLTSVYVAATSDHAGDHHLYVPIAGPWIDMANRGSCPTGSNACDNETTYKVLLGVDGVFQAIGALEIVGAFLNPEHREVTRVAEPAPIVIQPTRVGSGYGVGVFARF
jgi:hypothetical protein